VPRYPFLLLHHLVGRDAGRALRPQLGQAAREAASEDSGLVLAQPFDRAGVRPVALL
jgi:hypothetical protein